HNNFNRVLVYFWDNKTNDKSFDWLSYASAWMFSYDLTRTPNISSITPYSSSRMIKRLQGKGFEQATNIPLSLALQMAKKTSKKWFVLGSFAKNKDSKNMVFEAKLYKVENGKMLKSIKVEKDDMFQALDEISAEISQYLLSFKPKKENIIPDLAISDHISSNVDAIKLITKAMNAVAFNNDYKKAIKLLDKALEIDKNFVAVHVLAARYQQAFGDYQAAIKHIDAALAKDYKLYEEDIYELKSSKFYMQGKRDKAGLVQESWVRAFPESPKAHGFLAGYYLYSNNKLDLAENELNTLAKIDPDNPRVAINLGRIYRIQENKAKTLEILGQYLQQNPDNAEAYLQMGDALEQFGLFKKAMQLYEQASILGTQDYKAEIRKAHTMLQLGDYKKALNYLDELYENSQNDNQKYKILYEKITVLNTTGQNNRALKTLEKMKKYAKKVLLPFNYMFQIEDTKIFILNAQGKYQEALKYSKQLQANTKPPFDSFVGIFFIVTYGNMQDEKNYRIEVQKLKELLKHFNDPYWDSFLPAIESRVLAWDGKKQEAIKSLDESVTIIKQSISGLTSLDKINEIEYYKAKILLDIEQFKDAIEVLENILQRDPTFGKAYYLLAKIYKIQNKTKKFNQAYANAMKIWQDADDDFVDLVNLKKLKN
ncbi:MAG TPA: tetratricopeptide repeat protein, partial [Oceanospirillales bacterium]|nr:tetratricopeptide repeat protein [Oceanospirillales bacterium]